MDHHDVCGGMLLPEGRSSDTVEGFHLAEEHLGGVSAATNQGNNALKSPGLLIMSLGVRI